MEEQNYTIKFDKNILRLFQKALFKTHVNFHTTRFLFQTWRDQNRAVKRRAYWGQNGVQVPPLMIVSITNKCNLNCLGCYARAIHSAPEEEMTDDRLFALANEAEELGISIILIAGGEPLLRPVFFELAQKHPHILFLVFTNGLLINQAALKRFSQQRNLIPVISLEGQQMETDLRRGEGVFRLVKGKMKLLREKGLFFGISLTLTSHNFDVITSTDFQKELHRFGSQISFFVDYVPIQPETANLVLTPEQKRRESIWMKELSDHISGLFVSLPGDEAQYGGCLAGGRGFIHVNPRGELEACPFAPYSDTDLSHLSLKEALSSELLKVIRQNANQLTESQGGCTLWENRQWVLDQMAALRAQAE